MLRIGIDPINLKLILVGANGSGKSTLTKILAGYLKPTSGKVFLDQVRIDKIAQSQKASKLITKLL